MKAEEKYLGNISINATVFDKFKADFATKFNFSVKGVYLHDKIILSICQEPVLRINCFRLFMIKIYYLGWLNNYCCRQIAMEHHN